MSLKYLPIPATSVSAERVFSAAGENWFHESNFMNIANLKLISAGLLDKQRLRNNMSAETMESCLLLRLNYVGDRAREISYQPPRTLVTHAEFCDTASPSIPSSDETYGYMTDESDFDETASDDDEIVLEEASSDEEEEL